MYQAFVCTSQPLQQNLEVVEQCIQRNFAAEVGKILKFVAAVAWAYMATEYVGLTYCDTPTFDARQGSCSRVLHCRWVGSLLLAPCGISARVEVVEV